MSADRQHMPPLAVAGGSVLIVALFFGLTFAPGCATRSTTSASKSANGVQGVVALNQPAPPFHLKDVDGNAVSLAQFHGKPVFINVFATWCPPCKREIPDIVKSYPAYKAKVVYLGVDEQEDAESVKPFVTRIGIPYQVVLDPGPIAEHYDVTSLPESFFIDKDGVVRTIYRGFMTPSVLKDNLATIVK